MNHLKNLLFLLLIMASSAHGQEKPDAEEDSRRGKWYLVPELELLFSNYTIVEVAPQIAYNVTDRWSIGTGINYNYYQKLDTYITDGFKTHLYGGRLFTRYAVVTNAEEWLPFYLFSDIFLHLEFQAMNLEKRYFYAPSYPDDGRFWSEQIYLGAGLTQKFNRFSSYSFMVLWDLNRNIYTPYGNPVYRIGLNIYFR